MKYVVTRQFSFTKEKFAVVANGKTISKVKVTSASKEDERFNLKFCPIQMKKIVEDMCEVTPDRTNRQTYLITLKDQETNVPKRFGQFSYQSNGPNNYLYTIKIGSNLYKVRSSDLRDRQLTMIDSWIPDENQSRTSFGNTLCLVTDYFCKTTKNYHVTVHEQKQALAYLAIVILISLHERNRDI